MKKYINASFLSLSLLLAGCGQEEPPAPPPAKEEKEVKPVKKEVKQIKWAKKPLTLKKQKKILYQNLQGAVTYLGYTVNEEDKYIIAIQLEGDMQKMTENNMSINVILEDSTYEEIGVKQKTEVRETKEGKVQLYQLSTVAGGRHIARLDVNYSGDDEEVKKVSVRKPDGTITLPGVQALEKNTRKKLNLKQEGSSSVVRIDSFSVIPISKNQYSNELRLTGSIEYKEDATALPPLYYSYPYLPLSGEAKLQTDNYSSQVFAGTTVPFTVNIPMTQQIGKNEGVLYLSINNAVFGIDVTTGKKVTTVPLAGFLQTGNAIESESPGPAGFKDLSGEFHYDALQANVPLEKGGVAGDVLIGYYQFPVGGDYKYLSFRMGAAQAESLNEAGYVLQVYGDDYDLGNTGSPIIGQLLSKISPMETYTMDVTGMKTVTIHFNSQIPVREENEDRELKAKKFFPVIFSDITLSK